MTFKASLLLCATLLLQACASTLYAVPSGASDEAEYSAAFPYYVEFCALSEILGVAESAGARRSSPAVSLPTLGE